MSSSLELPTYETRLVTVPVVTEVVPRHRSLPGRVGPWPLKRSRSEADQLEHMSFSSFDDPWEKDQEKPSLGQVLKRIDEECATIETLVNKEMAITSAHEIERTSYEGDREQRKPHPLADLKTGCTNVLLIVLLLALLAAFVWPLVTTFVFGNKNLGKITLKKDGSSVAMLGVSLAVPIILIGMTFTISVFAIAELKGRGKMLHPRQKILWLAIGVLWIGVVMDVCILASFLTLTDHE